MIPPKGKWRVNAPSDKQKSLLRKYGITTIPKTRGECSDLITKILKEESRNPPCWYNAFEDWDDYEVGPYEEH